MLLLCAFFVHVIALEVVGAEAWPNEVHRVRVRAHDVVHGTKMKAGIILLCTKDNLFQEFKVEGAELEMYQNLFMGRVKKFYEMNNIS